MDPGKARRKAKGMGYHCGGGDTIGEAEGGGHGNETLSAPCHCFDFTTIVGFLCTLHSFSLQGGVHRPPCPPGDVAGVESCRLYTVTQPAFTWTRSLSGFFGFETWGTLGGKHTHTHTAYLCLGTFQHLANWDVTGVRPSSAQYRTLLTLKTPRYSPKNRVTNNHK